MESNDNMGPTDDAFETFINPHIKRKSQDELFKEFRDFLVKNNYKDVLEFFDRITDSKYI